MIRKEIIIITFLTCRIFASQLNISRDAIKEIYDQREYIVSLWDDCEKISVPLNGKYPCIGFQFYDVFEEFETRDLDDWRNNEVDLFMSFRGLCQNISASDKKAKSVLLTDTNLVKIALACLADMGPNKQSINSIGANIIRQMIPYTLIEANSSTIRQVIKDAAITLDEKEWLIGFTGLDTAEVYKVTGSRYRYFSLQTKAKLGDMQAESQIMETLENEKDYSKLKHTIEALGYIGTAKTLNTIASRFGETWSDTNIIVKRYNINEFYLDTCIAETIKYPILLEFQKNYPTEEIFNRELHTLIKKNNQEKISDYYNRVANWFSKKYGIEYKERTFKPHILFTLCPVKGRRN